MSFLRSLIFNRTVLGLLVAGCFVVTGLDMYFDDSRATVINFAALEIAKNDIAIISQFSAAYKKEFGARGVSEKSEEELIVLFNGKLQEIGSDLCVALITPTSAKDEFQKEAALALEKNPSAPFYSIETTPSENEILRYAVVHPAFADITGNPKAILEFDIPMGDFVDIENKEATKALWVLIAMAILSSTSLAIFVGYLRHSAQVLAKTQQKALEEQKKLTYAYERFFPHQFLVFLEKKSILDLNLGDHTEKKLAVLFADIRNFTSIIEKKSPAESFQFINDYLGQVSPIIRNQSGFIDKYIGDAIMAVFERSEDALVATIKIMNLLAANIPGNGSKRVTEIGVGIHYGSLMVGTVGEKERMDGTVISDIVNTASRLEGLNKDYGTRIIITERVVSNLLNKEKFQIRFIDHVYLKGKTNDVKIYEIFDIDPPDLIERKKLAQPDYEKGVDCYGRAQFEPAIDYFKRCQRLLPNDLVIELYLNRCLHRMKEEPPLEGWDPIAKLSQKDIIE